MCATVQPSNERLQYLNHRTGKSFLRTGRRGERPADLSHRTAKPVAAPTSSSRYARDASCDFPGWKAAEARRVPKGSGAGARDPQDPYLQIRTPSLADAHRAQLPAL